jgi:HupE / UreJ protein
MSPSIPSPLDAHHESPRLAACVPLQIVWIAIVGLVTAGLLSAGAASGHGRSVSYSSWEIAADGAQVSVRLKLLELSRLGPDALPPGSLPGYSTPGSQDLPSRALPRELALLADGEPCRAPGAAERRPDEPGWVRYRWQIECPENAETLTIRSRILLDVAPSHMHFARVRFSDTSETARESVLTEASSEWVVRQTSNSRASTSAGSDFTDYVALGIEHILSGWDHLAFVFGLLLLAGRFGEVARLITGFTLAHSLTLALAVLDWVHPNAGAVEALIAFSVALVAIEKGWISSGRGIGIPISIIAGLVCLGVTSLLGWSSLPLLTVSGLILFSGCYFALVARDENGWLRICLTFAFGLVHGFGFAGILVEMTLPGERLVPALLGFNVGVEIGQLGIVLLIWPMLMLGRRFATPRIQHWGVEFSTSALCGLGVYWLIDRAFST